MVRLAIFLLILSIIITVGGILSIFVAPDMANPILEALVCAEGMNLVRDETPTTIRNSRGVNIRFTCEGDGESERVDEKITMVTIALFMLPFITSTFLIFAVIGRAVSSMRRTLDPLSGTVMPTSGFQTWSSQQGTIDMQTVDLSKGGTFTQGDFSVSKTPDGRVEINMGGMPFEFPSGSSTNFGGELTLKEKLQQLEDAYKAGLITMTEYDDRKRQILDDLTKG